MSPRLPAPSSLPPETLEELRAYVNGGDGDRYVPPEVQRLASAMLELEHAIGLHKKDDELAHMLIRKDMESFEKDMDRVTQDLDITGIHSFEDLKEGYKEQRAKNEARHEFWMRTIASAVVGLVASGIGWLALKALTK